MRLSDRIISIPASATVAIITRAQQMKAEGIDVVSFGAGEPDFDTPQFIKDAAKAALDAGDTKYNPRKLKALKQAICDKLARDNAVTASPDQVAVTFGGKHALYDAFQVLLNPGDKVLIPAPYWVSYPEQVKLAGGVPVAMPTRAESGFKITPRQVLDLAGDAKIIVLNSPSNPTGVTYTRDELAALAEAILKTGLAVFSDEIYENLVYGDTKFCSMAAVEPRLADRLVIFNGLAKAFSMTGWRLGWAVGPKDVIGAIDRLMSHETTNPVSFAVAGAYEAYTNPKAPAAIEAMRAAFEIRGRHLHGRLIALPGVTCVEPTGAFYCFPDISRHFGRTIGGVKVDSSMTFAQACLEGARVALVPGDAFGEDRCVRLSFATSMAEIDKGLDRLEKLLKEGSR